jgi:hypothetical protein
MRENMKIKTTVVTAICVAVFLGTAPLASADVECEFCGPGADWIDACTSGGDDVMTSTKALVGIYLAPDCSDTPNSFVLYGGMTVNRASSGGTDTIVTEITAMDLEGGGFQLIVGANQTPDLTRQTLGTIVEQADDNTIGDSIYAVYFEAVIPGIGPVWNHDPLGIAAEITCVPPKTEYLHPQGQCIAFYDAPGDGDGVVVGYIGTASHITFPVPAVSEWGIVVMTLLILGAGTVLLNRRRRPAVQA